MLDVAQQGPPSPTPGKLDRQRCRGQDLCQDTEEHPHCTPSDAESESIDLSGDEEPRSLNKGKQRANQIPDEDPVQEPNSGRLNTRTIRRLSFLRDLSFLDPPSAPVSSLEADADLKEATCAREPAATFPDPAPVSSPFSA